jgi:hypothetical protein
MPIGRSRRFVPLRLRAFSRKIQIGLRPEDSREKQKVDGDGLTSITILV